MHLLFATSIVPDGALASGYEIANAAIIDALRRAGAKVTVLGFTWPGKTAADPDNTIVLGSVDVRTDARAETDIRSVYQRWFARGATLVCSAFEDTYTHLRTGCRVRITGNPTRRGFAELSELDPVEREARRTSSGLRLLILGGSGGARSLNEQTPLAIYKAGAALQGWEIVHQTGERDLEATRELYRKLGLTATVVPFIDHIARALLESQFVISRAGGTTLAELACAAMPTVLAPFPRATDDHQRKNAEAFVVAGGALMVDERDVSGRFDDALAATVIKLATDDSLRQRMSLAMLRAARPDAARIVARIVGDILRAGQFTNAA